MQSTAPPSSTAGSLPWQKIAFSLSVLVIPLLPGYVHPDEWAQGPAICAEDFLGIEGGRAWEFLPENALRSPLAQYISTGPAILLSRLLHNATRGLPILDRFYAGAWIYICVRYWTALCTLGAFVLLRRTLKTQLERERADASTWICLTSYVPWVFGVRAFSNTVEMNLAVVCLYLVFGGKQNQTHGNCWRTAALAAIAALGIFTRPTFAMYALALGIAQLLQVKRISRRGESSVDWRLAAARYLVAGSFSFLLVSTIFVLADSLYYKGHLSLGSLVLTPYNHMAFNLSGKVGDRFGYTPWWMNCCPYMMLLVGPAWIVSIGLWISMLYRRCWAPSAARSVGDHPYSPLPTYSPGPGSERFPKDFDHYLRIRSLKGTSLTPQSLNRTALAMFVLPLIMLSLPAHAEPRFLLPAVIAFFVCSPATLRIYNGRWLKVIWLIFNFCGLVFYGILHRSGVVMAPLMLEHATKSPVGVVRHLVVEGLVPPLVVSTYESDEYSVQVMHGLPKGKLHRPVDLPPLAYALDVVDRESVRQASYYLPGIEVRESAQTTVDETSRPFILLDSLSMPFRLPTSANLRVSLLTSLCGTLKIPYPVRTHMNVGYWWEEVRAVRKAGGFGWEIGCMGLFLVEQAEPQGAIDIPSDSLRLDSGLSNGSQAFMKQQGTSSVPTYRAQASRGVSPGIGRQHASVEDRAVTAPGAGSMPSWARFE